MSSFKARVRNKGRSSAALCVSAVSLVAMNAHPADDLRDLQRAGFSSSAGQQAGIFAEPALSDAPSDTVIVEGSRVDLFAGTEGQQASITYGNFAKNRWRLQFTTPIDKESEEGQFANLDGLTSATRITWEMRRYAFWHIPDRSTPVDEALSPLCRQLVNLIGDRVGDDLQKIRSEMMAPVVQTGDRARLACQTGYFDRTRDLAAKESSQFQKSVKELRERVYQELAAGIWFAIQSFKFTGGRQNLDFVDSATATKQASHENVWSAEATAAWYKRKFALLAVGVRYEDAYEPKKPGTVCPPSSDAPVTCVSGPVGPADNRHRKIAFGEMKVEPMINRKSPGFALAPRVSYEFEGHHWAVDLPIYLLQSEKGGFVGGIRVGYTEEEDDNFSAGVFVGKKFDLLDN